MLLTLACVVAVLALAAVASWYLLPDLWLNAVLGPARRLAGVRPERRCVDGVDWYFLAGGTGPTLVLLHGFAAEADHWLPVAGLLRGRFRMLIPDLPGFGHSAPAAGLAFDIGEQARRVWAWLDALEVGPCLLAGNSMGGWIAARCAADRPQQVQAVWLQDPAGVNTAATSEMMRRIEEGRPNPFVITSPRDYQRLASEMIARRAPLPYPVLRAGYRRVRALVPELQRLQEQILSSTPIEELAPRLTMPVLVQWGEADRAVHVSGARVLERLLPDPEVAVHQGVGHLPMLETPLGSARLFLAFCEQHGLVETRDG